MTTQSGFGKETEILYLTSPGLAKSQGANKGCVPLQPRGLALSHPMLGCTHGDIKPPAEVHLTTGPFVHYI